MISYKDYLNKVGYESREYARFKSDIFYDTFIDYILDCNSYTLTQEDQDALIKELEGILEELKQLDDISGDKKRLINNRED